MSETTGSDANDIAIVGIAAHLPGAHTPGEFWRNLRDGVESIVPLADDELLAAGVSTDVLRRPGYVKSAAVLDGVYDFDAEFFGFSPKEAGILDPQHRHFLMAVWEALEDAGHVPERFDGAIGVFAGCGTNSYYVYNILTNPDLVRDVGLFLLRHTGNDKDFLATRASYLFDLRGPAVNVQTACSTSLVATHLAVQHLLSGEVDLALAGGVTIEVPHGHGYQYLDGEILSPDGHCRAFDHQSQGTVFGSGVGVVALRRLDDAIADGDHVYAVIKGTAVNNDGAQKVGYLAPSVDGQAACIAEALGVADVEPDTLGYVECHGTGTPMGDPIEIAALTQAFRGAAGDSDDQPAPIGIGSVKTNIGHLDTAAGVAALAKVALALHHGEIPPSLNFEAPNPLLDLESSPFDVVRTTSPWPEGRVRRAGVNSLGVGGTNAFAILEEAPGDPRPPSSRRWRLLTLSARNRGSLDGASARLGEHLDNGDNDADGVDLGDVAWTLYHGRRRFSERRVVAARDTGEASELLRAGDPRRVFSHTTGTEQRRVALLFPGGGAQHLGMAAGLYDAEPEFRRHLDAGLDELQRRHGLDLRAFLLEAEPRTPERTHDFELMAHQLPSIFLVEYALAQLLISWGIEFDALAGHSVGENTAACVAGTMSFSDCLGLVVLRGRLMDRVGGGAVAVPLPPDEVAAMADEFGLDLAVVNAPDLSVVSGELDVLARFEEKVRAAGTEPQRVRLNVAAHSRVLDPILPEFRAYVDSITLSAPRTPWVSNRSGTWITDEQACDPGYWVEHLRNTVRFAECITTLAAEPGRVLLEVGPGKTLSSLARMNPELKSGQPAIPTMRHADDDIDDEAALVAAVGRLWATGYDLPAGLESRLFDDGGRPHRRLSLPTYAFQTQRYFIAPGTSAGPTSATTTYVDREPDPDRWYWEPVWRSHDADVADGDEAAGSWLVFLDEAGVGEELVEQLRADGDDVTVVRHGDSYLAASETDYVIAPENGLADYESLMGDLVRTGRVPNRIAHFALVATDDRQYRPGSSFFHRNQELGFQSLVFLAKAWARSGVAHPVHLIVATMCSQRVVPADVVQWPEQATVLGPVGVIPREFPGFTVTAVDIDQRDLFPESRLRTRLDLFADTVSAVRSDGLGAVRRPQDAPSEARIPRRERLVDSLRDELRAPAANRVVALRGDRRYVLDVRRTAGPALHTPPRPTLRRGGAVLISGGLGGIGLTVADELFSSAGARIALLSRHQLPPRDTWSDVVGRLGDRHPTSERIRGVQRLEAAGAEVLLLAGDVTDITQMRKVVADVRTAFGGIHGIVHAAGVVADELIVAKPVSEMDDVLAPKVYGTTVLDEVTIDDELDLFVVFSSTSTVSTPIGQVDYVAANAFLNSWVESRRAIGRSEVTAINWGVWNEVGMAAGVLHDTDPPAAAPAPTAATHPWFEHVSVDGRGVARIRASWSTARDWFLADHRTADGAALLPGSAYPELARAALAEIGVRQPFALRNLTFLRPLPAPDGVDVGVRIELTPTEAGYDLVVSEGVTVPSPTAEDSNGGGRHGWRPVAQASLELRALQEPEPVDVDTVMSSTIDREPVRTSQQDHLRFGPRWDVVERVTSGGGRAVALLRLPDAFADDLEEVHLHPGLLDLGTGFAMSLVEGYSGDRLWVPVSHGSIRVFDRLTPQLVAVASARRGSSEQRGFARFDVTICDVSGRVLIEVAEFTIKRLDGVLDLGGSARVLASEVTFDAEPAGARPRSQAELVLQHNVSQGIVPAEGREGFARAVGSGLPVVYVSSMDLPAVRRQADSAAAAQSGGGAEGGSAVFGRPNLASEYVAPRNELEESLVAIWQELLGIDEVGVNDNFFDLGGHSLIAVRLFTRVKRTFSVDFPISVLFEAPTVADIAGLIAAALPAESAGDGQADDAVGTVADSPARFNHLVPMHLGEGGARTPFFLVAGMFGNVMNLRHLAHLIGTDRPFYGVQARGLFGGAEPHETFVEMAADYLAEVRSVQPAGPYLLGGFSGGGIAAYEMAQQLLAAGEEVALLVLLDTPLAENDPLFWLDRLKIQRDNLQEKGVSYVKEWAVNRVRWERERRRRRSDDELGAAEGVLHSSEIEAAFYRALAAYETMRYDGTITLYRPPLSPLHVLGPDRQINIDRRFIFHDNGWSRWCDDVEVIEVPGTHDSMVLEPNVRVLAGHLRSTIESVEDR